VIQIAMSFQPGLTQEFKTLRQVTQAAVLRTRGGITSIAPAADMSPSQLSRKLQGNPEDPHRTLDIDAWEEVVGELVGKGDFTPIFYLLEKFKLSSEQRQGVAIARLETLLQEVASTLADAKGPTPTKRGSR
jgi:hypothetical protein